MCREHFNLIKSSCVYVDLTEDECEFIKEQALRSAVNSKKEKRQETDKDGLDSRFFSGFVGEYAVGKFLGVSEQFNGSYIGGSYSNKHPDLMYLGYKLGIKTSRVGKTIKFNLHTSEPQLVCQYAHISEYGKAGIRVFICGIMLPEYIQVHSDRDWIEEPKLRNRWVKLGFFKFDKLIPFNLDAIKEYKSNLQISNILYDTYDPILFENLDKGCVYMEKDVGYTINVVPYPVNTKLNKRYISFSSDLSSEDSEDIQEIVEYLKSYDVIIGYGIGGYLRNLQSHYNLDDFASLRYLDLSDIIIKDDNDKGLLLGLTWLNTLYCWVDYLKFDSLLIQEEDERDLYYRCRLCIEYIKNHTDTCLSISINGMIKYTINRLKNTDCLVNLGSFYEEMYQKGVEEMVVT